MKQRVTSHCPPPRGKDDVTLYRGTPRSSSKTYNLQHAPHSHNCSHDNFLRFTLSRVRICARKFTRTRTMMISTEAVRGCDWSGFGRGTAPLRRPVDLRAVHATPQGLLKMAKHEFSSERSRSHLPLWLVGWLVGWLVENQNDSGTIIVGVSPSFVIALRRLDRTHRDKNTHPCRYALGLRNQKCKQLKALSLWQLEG